MTCYFKNVSRDSEVQCWTLHQVRGVATTNKFDGSNGENTRVSHVNVIYQFLMVFGGNLIEIYICPAIQSCTTQNRANVVFHSTGITFSNGSSSSLRKLKTSVSKDLYRNL